MSRHVIPSEVDAMRIAAEQRQRSDVVSATVFGYQQPYTKLSLFGVDVECRTPSGDRRTERILFR